MRTHGILGLSIQPDEHSIDRTKDKLFALDFFLFFLLYVYFILDKLHTIHVFYKFCTLFPSINFLKPGSMEGGNSTCSFPCWTVAVSDPLWTGLCVGEDDRLVHMLYK